MSHLKIKLIVISLCSPSHYIDQDLVHGRNIGIIHFLCLFFGMVSFTSTHELHCNPSLSLHFTSVVWCSLVGDLHVSCNHLHCHDALYHLYNLINIREKNHAIFIWTRVPWVIHRAVGGIVHGYFRDLDTTKCGKFRICLLHLLNTNLSYYNLIIHFLFI